MRASAKFLSQDKGFWAHVRSLSEQLGYSRLRQMQPRYVGAKRSDAEKRRADMPYKLDGRIYAPTFQEILEGMDKLELFSDHLIKPKENPEDLDKPTPYATLLVEYFQHRADELNNFARLHLLTLSQARAMYARLKKAFPNSAKVAMNKQTGDKATESYLTNMVNLLIVANAEGIEYVPDPGELTTFTKGQKPIRTLARRVDGAFCKIINPVAVWEIKEYYHTTTFGSRVSGGVYETLLDGLELEEMQEHEGIGCEHVLIIDALECWWADGRSYLCRMIDSLHMGYVDEILFGKEIEERLPLLTKGWVGKIRAQQVHAEAVALKGQIGML